MEKDKRGLGEIMAAVCMTGAVWGIFEATVGYLLHLLPIRLGFLVWYPAASILLEGIAVLAAIHVFERFKWAKSTKKGEPSHPAFTAD